MNWYKQTQNQITTKDIAKKWEQQGININIIEENNIIILDTLVIPLNRRKQGIGTQIMQELINYADQVEKRFELSPGQKGDFKGTTSRGRLVNFYKRFGFIENKGRNKDFIATKEMYRNPNELV